MTSAETLRTGLVAVEADEQFSEAVLRLHDQSRLCFCHRVEERWAKAVGPEQSEAEGGLAEVILAGIQMFGLNSKHLDIQFADGSRWDEPLQELPGYRT